MVVFDVLGMKPGLSIEKSNIKPINAGVAYRFDWQTNGSTQSNKRKKSKSNAQSLYVFC